MADERHKPDADRKAGGVVGGYAHTDAVGAASPTIIVVRVNSSTGRLLVDSLSSSVPATSGGLDPYQAVSAASNNADTVKASAGQIYSIQVFNNSANIGYLKFYNKASNPNPAADTPIKTILIPANTSGSGAVFDFGNLGLEFDTGIAVAIVGGIATNDNTAVAADAMVVNIDYK